MPRQFFGFPLEQTDFVLVDDQIVADIEKYLFSCENCNPSAEMSFDGILDEIMGRNPLITEYVLERTAKCPSCGGEIHEKTLVDVGW
jgi:hypothetical protein